MIVRTQTRRDFLRVSAASPLILPFLNPTGRTMADETKAKNERPRLGLIGAGGQGSGDARGASRYGDFLAVCDVDKRHAERAKADGRIGKGKADIYEDYRKVLERKDIDAVIIGTPDHWHTKICIDAMKAGKDVYCEKPLTLTIDEGKKLGQVARDTRRVVQVGTQQRSDHNRVFLLAVALVRSGRIGQIKKVTAAIGGAPTGGPFPKTAAPSELNWDLWLGQAPKVDYIANRCHNDFRWWYEYSGGKLTDWGAHHVDIGQWAIGMEDSGPNTIEVVKGVLPVDYKDGFATVDDRFNTATEFLVKATFANGVEMHIRHDTENGVTFEGTGGKIFVTRDRIDLTGGAVDGLYRNPVPDSLLVQLRKGKRVDGHMANFFECARDRSVPASDVWTHHRALTTCHLANIALRLGGRKLTWDPAREEIVGDSEANAWQTRTQRAGFEVSV
ncbi:Gfo/Idh/MocA family protein [Singulisphaera sp. PoT]|uniref:Gfo/Idh/MocA family protein n=1 Tax=Singulisphaera sp. PoT TaxID=3411797 RepID=UPI003BF5FC2E